MFAETHTDSIICACVSASAAIIQTGRYTDKDLEQIVGGNFLRVWRRVEEVSGEWTAPALEGAEANLYTSSRNRLSEEKKPSTCHYQWLE